jgi:asparagine synthase (glutamine-hydrolysing)
MFNKLDAEFVVVLYDGKENKIIAARDPIGIRPLFYGFTKENEICFASEVKGLIHLVGKVYPFPPGHYYLDGKFVSYTDLYDQEESSDQVEEILPKLKTLLTDGIINRLHADAPLGFLLSGGLDSSLVCAVAAKHLKKPIQTFSIGMDTDAIDLKYAKDVANHIGSIHHEVIMTKKDVLNALEEVIIALESYDITTIRASIGMFLVAKYIRENTNIKVLLTGEVSDELFGYKYTDFAPDAKSFQDESIKRIKELYLYDVLRADRTLAYHSLEARVPFADLAFAKYVLSINPKFKMNTYNMGKYLIRKAFDKDNILPNHILWRQKAAFSDAVGHSMVDELKTYAESLYTDDLYVLKVKQYKVNPPISKESLLYREIFEKHYKNHEHLIPGFWMPNQTWKGLEDVIDPSARVLKNYGDSGK